MENYNLFIKISTQMKNLVFTSIFNFSLFVFLMVGIQNSSNKSKVNLFFNETIDFPISFILGSSFIIGSLTGSFLTSNLLRKD